MTACVGRRGARLRRRRRSAAGAQGWPRAPARRASMPRPAARRASGTLTVGGLPPDGAARIADQARQAWSDAGREDSPRLMELCYVALGDGAREAADVLPQGWAAARTPRAGRKGAHGPGARCSRTAMPRGRRMDELIFVLFPRPARSPSSPTRCSEPGPRSGRSRRRSQSTGVDAWIADSTVTAAPDPLLRRPDCPAVRVREVAHHRVGAVGARAVRVQHLGGAVGIVRGHLQAPISPTGGLRRVDLAVLDEPVLARPHESPRGVHSRRVMRDRCRSADCGDQADGQRDAADRDALHLPSHSSCLQLQDVRRLGLDSALDHVEVGALDGLEPVAVDDLEPAADPLAERVPGIGDPRLQAGWAPVG